MPSLSHRQSPRHLLLIALVLVAACAAYAPRLSGPLIHYHDWTLAEFSLSARNTLRYGLLTTRFGQVTNVETARPDAFHYYIHTPPGLVFLVAGMFRLIGYHAYASRLVALFMTLLADSALYALARRLYGRQASLWGLVFFAFTPATAYFGPMVEYDSMMAAIMLLVVGFYLKGLRRARPGGWLLPILALAVIGMWSGWLMVVFLPLLWLHAQTLGSQPTRRGMWLVGVVALVAAGLLIASFAWQRADFLAELGSVVRARTSNASPAGQIFTTTENAAFFTWQEWLTLQAKRVLWMFTPTVVGLALFGALRSWQTAPKSENVLVLILFLTSLIYVMIVRQALFIHEYLLFTLGVSMAIWSGWGLAVLWQRWRRAPVLRATLVLLVILYGVASVLWTVGVYYNRRQPEYAAIGQALAERTQVGEHIATDMRYAGPVPAFYANRAIIYSVPPDTDLVTDRLADWYLYCAEDQTISPEWLDAYPHDPLLDCELVKLR